MTSAAGQELADSPGRSVDIRILGGISVRLTGARVQIGDAKHRLMLAMLVAAEGRLVSTEQLIDQIWDDHPPRTARDLIHSYASDLRRCLEVGLAGASEMLPRHHDGGYQLLADRDSVDLYRFRDLASRARSLAGHDDPRAVALLRHALSLWDTGTRADPGDGPLTDLNATPVADCKWLEGYRQALREEHRTALIACLEAQLRLGEHEPLTAKLADLAALDPLDERIAGLLMIAYYRIGRQARATQVYQRIQRRLRSELGVEPRPSLKELYRRILNQDAELDLPAPDRPNPAIASLESTQVEAASTVQSRSETIVSPHSETEAVHARRPAVSTAPTWSTASDHKLRRHTQPFSLSEKYLVGRASEIAAFDSSLARNDGRSLLNIYGPSGIGKSVVCWKLMEHARRRGFLVGVADVSMYGSSSIVLLRELIHSMLAQDRGYVNASLYEIAGQLDEFDTVSEFVQCGGGIDQMFDAVGSPKNELLLNTMINETGGTFATTMHAVMRNRFALERYLRTAAQRLGSSFTDALAAAEDEGDRAVILLDTYEEVRTLDVWVRRTLIPGMPNTARLIILGRNHLPQQNFDWADHADLIHTHLLPELAEDEAKSYLAHHGLSDPAALNEIYRVTGGYPLLLVLVRQLADGVGGWAAVGHLDHSGDRDLIASQLLTRILREERVHEVREVLEKCAIASWINPEIIKALLDVTSNEARDVYEKVQLHSFMERHPEGVRLHEKIRALLVDRLRFTSQEEFNRLEGKLLAYHSSKVSS
jgi:DNA-binding SARP family transcriptional activator